MNMPTFRRELLKSASVAASLPFITSEIQAANDRDHSNDHQYFDRDIGIYNNSQSEKTVRIQVKTDDGRAMYDKEFRMNGFNQKGNHAKSETRYEGNISVSGDGKFELEARVGDTKESTSIFVSNSKVDDAMMASVHIWPDGQVDVGHSIH